MDEKRLLIVNADDLGFSGGVNAGIAEAHQRGIVTSASLMVRQGAAREAVHYAGENPSLSVGLHIDLAQWDYVKGAWRLAYQRCPPDQASAVEAECRAQLELFRGLCGRDPTHLDSHQHLHMSEPLASVAARLASELDLPLRSHGIRYEGSFYGQGARGEALPAAITARSLAALIGSLPLGWTELACHPGLGMRGESSYASEREREVKALCDRRVKEAIAVAGIELRSFAELH